MSPEVGSKFRSISCVGSTCKTLLILGLILYVFSIFLFNHPNCPASELFSPLVLKWSSSSSQIINHTPTTISHLLFGLLGSVEAWKNRKPYIESWWRPNVTRGYLYLDKPPTKDLLPWSSLSPAYKVSEDISQLLKETKHVAPIMVRMVHGILEVFREKHEGGHSESIMSNFWYSFDTGFGGAGFILSYALAEALVKDIENCFRRYPYLRSADQITMTCIADQGVSLTAHRGIHQIDLRGDISGFLSAHPQTPVLSLHHLDAVNPIFPNKTRAESVDHLMKTARVDHSRLLQQTVCYHRHSNWSFSVSWGYSTHVYEKVITRSILKRPLETFKAWVEGNPPRFMFDTRRLSSDDPCEAPHVFFFDSIQKSTWDGRVVSSYVRASPRGLPSCSSTRDHSADHILKILVLSPSAKLVQNGRSECCEILHEDGRKVAKVKLRACMKHEIIA